MLTPSAQECYPLIEVSSHLSFHSKEYRKWASLCQLQGFSLAYLDDWSKFDALNFNCMLISVRGWFLMEKRGALFPKVGMLEGYVKSRSQVYGAICKTGKNNQKVSNHGEEPVSEYHPWVFQHLSCQKLSNPYQLLHLHDFETLQHAMHRRKSILSIYWQHERTISSDKIYRYRWHLCALNKWLKL